MASVSKLQLTVLAAVARLDGDGYGVTISDEVSRREKRDVPYSTVHILLRRLLEEGFVTAKMGEPTAERGGRRKRHYKITGVGRRALSEAWSHSETTFAGIDWLRPKPAGA